MVTWLLKRLVPFSVTLACGISLSFVLSYKLSKERTLSVSLKSTQVSCYDNEAPFAGNERQTFDITDIQYWGWTGHTQVTFHGGDSVVTDKQLTTEEQALIVPTGLFSLGSGNNFVVSYVEPHAVDCLPVNQNATVLDVPRPNFWVAEMKHWTRGQECNVIVRVNLGADGNISNAEPVPTSSKTCTELSDVISAAKDIKFKPAVRNGLPVSQRISILYRLH